MGLYRAIRIWVSYGRRWSRIAPVKYTVSLALVLYGVWLLWSGHYGLLLLTFGAVSCAGVVALTRRMGILDEESVPIELVLRFLRYGPWLLWEIVRANVDVARRILDPRLPIQPRVIRVRASQRHDLSRTIYANSITLTPGTVSVDIEGDEITVHALSRDAAESLERGEMDRRVSRIEGPA